MTGQGGASLSLCGTAVRADRVQQLAAFLRGEKLAEKLERAVANRNTIVALSIEERERIVEVLARTPGTLPDLRVALDTQVRKHRQREGQATRASRDRAMLQLRRGPARSQ